MIKLSKVKEKKMMSEQKENWNIELQLDMKFRLTIIKAFDNNVREF